MRIFVVVLIILGVVAGCSSEKEARTVEWYLAHPDERQARQEECKLLGLKALEDRDCIAASEALKQAMMEGFGEVGEKKPKNQFPELKY